MNITSKADSELSLSSLKEECKWDLISDLSEEELIIVDSLLKKIEHGLRKKGIKSRLKSRAKSFESALAKCKEKNLEPTFDNILGSLYDLAAGRIIVSTLDDIDIAKGLLMARKLDKSAPFVIIEERDYIENPKDNGYQSYHVIIQFEVTFDNVVYPMMSEIQIRTNLQDSWSENEHAVGYKNSNQSPELKEDLKTLSKMIKQCDEFLAKSLRDEDERKKH